MNHLLRGVVPGIEFPTTYEELNRLSDDQVFNRCYGDRSEASLIAREAFARARQIFTGSTLAEHAQAQQLRYALNALDKIAKGIGNPDDYAELAIKHITCGTYKSEQDIVGGTSFFARLKIKTDATLPSDTVEVRDGEQYLRINIRTGAAETVRLRQSTDGDVAILALPTVVEST